MVSRFGGDEFAMLLTGRTADGRDEFEDRIADAHERLTDKVELDGITFEVGASLGVVEWPAQGSDSATLLRRADTAMYEAKRNQLGVAWYSPELDADEPRRLDLYMTARSALESEDIYIHLQPKVSLDDGAITGAEALVRWTHPEHGPVSALEFVPLVEQAGLIGKLTRQVLRLAVDAAARLRDAGIVIPVAVNLTPRDLLDPSLPDDVERLLTSTGVAPTQLQVEVTEGSMVVDFDASVSVLSRLRTLGVQISIDDFGTGYSSMQHLHRLPVDELKIDRSFVSRITTDESAAAIVRASINLAHDLGLTTVGEVEQAELDVAVGTELVERRLALGGIARGERDQCPTPCELGDGGRADPRVGAGDEHPSAADGPGHGRWRSAPAALTPESLRSEPGLGLGGRRRSLGATLSLAVVRSLAAASAKPADEIGKAAHGSTVVGDSSPVGAERKSGRRSSSTVERSAGATSWICSPAR